MKKSKVMETLWTSTLLTIIVVGCFYLLLLGAQCYQNVVSETNNSENERLPVLYIATALRQTDMEQVSLEMLEGVECLSIEHDGYKKLIYAESGYLKEITIKQGAVFMLKDGEKISKSESAHFEIGESSISYQIEVNKKTIHMTVALR